MSTGQPDVEVDVIKRLRNEVDNMERTIDWLDQELATRQQTVTWLEEELAKRQATVAWLTEELAKRDEGIRVSGPMFEALGSACTPADRSGQSGDRSNSK